jgi:hypothetical protein
MKIPGAWIREGFLSRLPHCLLLAVAFLGETFSVDRPILKSISLCDRMLHSLIEAYISKFFGDNRQCSLACDDWDGCNHSSQAHSVFQRMTKDEGRPRLEPSEKRKIEVPGSFF